MILFTLSAAALTAVVIGIILPALQGRRPVNRDHSARQNIRIARRRLGEIAPAHSEVGAEARAEIETALLDDLADGPNQPPPKTPGKAWTVLLLGMIPLVSAGLYLVLGTPTALRTQPPAIAAALQNLSPEKAPSVEELIAQLEQKLAANPGNSEGWALAGATYMRLGRFEEAARAYQTLHQLVGDDPHVLTAWADAALMANNGAFSPQIRARLERALALRPGHDNALWLAALEAESRSDYPQALDYLERLLPRIEEGREDAAAVKQFVARMRQAVTEDSPANAVVSASAEKNGDARPGAGALTVAVRLDPKLAEELRRQGRADQRVYVFAKAVNGPPMPVAVSQHRASELPVTITLDDSMAMLEGVKISTFAQVSVMARLSRSGEPIARPGDVESAAVVTRTDNPPPLSLVINQVVGDTGQAGQ